MLYLSNALQKIKKKSTYIKYTKKIAFDDLSKNWNFVEICVIRYTYCIPSIFIRKNVTKCMFFLIEYQPGMSYIRQDKYVFKVTPTFVS